MKHIRHYTSFACISVLILLLICFLHPTLSAVLFPWKRQILLQSFNQQVNTEKKIDPRQFWKLREFYYPGSLTVAKTGLKSKPLRELSTQVDPLLFTQFRSSFVQSDEFLVRSNSLNLILGTSQYAKDASYILNEDTHSVHLMFVLPISAMITTNGFYDSKDKDKKLLEGKYWFVNTVIEK
jgi:hypothetical protein